jgi:hypothetical protein
MTLAVLFWVLYIISILASLWLGYVPGQPYPFQKWGGGLLTFILVGILGFGVFGSPVK